MDDLLTQFLIEAPEQIELASDALLKLERIPTDRTAVDEAFRAIHTLKGSVGLFDLPAFGEVLHRAEDLLGAVRSGARTADPPTIAALLAVLGQAERWLENLGARGALAPDANDVAKALIARIAAPLAAPATPKDDWSAALAQSLPASTRADPCQAIRYLPTAEAYFRGDDPLAIVAAAPGLVHMRLALRAPAFSEPYDPFTCALCIEAVSTAGLDALRGAFRLVSDQVAFASIPSDASPASAEPLAAEAAIQTLRVDVSRIDTLAALTTDLVAAKTALTSAVSTAGQAADIRSLAETMSAHAAQIDRLANRLHEATMALRLAPIAPVLRRFPRLAREMAQGVGKEIELTVEDSGVEVDKTIVEGLFEPLTHLVRNAVDHGVESPSARLKAGKPPKGRITLSSRSANGRLIIRLSDDGGGIDVEAIRRRVAERGLLDEAPLRAMTDADIVNLVFLPGFSTTDRVTHLSGRGVGMDAVRAVVEGLGGTVSLSSTPGKGADVELALPLAVSLTKVLVVRDGSSRYGLPLDQVFETLRLAPERIVPIRGASAFNWRDRAVPLLPLSTLTGGPHETNREEGRVVVVKGGGQPTGLIVEAIEDRLDVSMRPLDGLLAGMPGICGAAVLGDGEILMILDAKQVAQ